MTEAIINNLKRMKTFITYLVFILCVSSFANAQNKYKRVYTLENNHFLHSASYTTGNAIIYVDRDSLIENLQTIAKYSGYSEASSKRIKSTADTIKTLSQYSDITNISSLVLDPQVISITLSYFSKCVLNKKANVLDKRTNEYVKEIIVKKAKHTAKKSSAYSYYHYYLPKSREEFMYRIERSGSGGKFL